MADEPAAGTPAAPPEGAVLDSGTPGAGQDGSGAATVDADELKKLRDIREQFLREKDNTERIRQENEILRQQMEQASRASTPPTGYDPAAQRLAQSYQNLAERDPEAAELIAATARLTQEQLTRQQAEQRFYRELGTIPAEDREETERIARAEQLWPSIAHNAVFARRYQKERTDLADQRRRIQEEDERRKRGVVSTTASPSPPASNSNEPTREKYAETARLAGAGNPAALKQMREWDRREESEGPLKFRSG